MNCWLTTNRNCNMCCSWCYGKEQLKNKAANMSLETLDAILRAIATTPISWFILIGGEPTVHPDLPTMIRRLKPKQVTMVSNGVKLADKAYLAELKESGLDKVAFSLKGATDEEYRENTGVACMRQIEQAVANLNELGVGYNISVTISDAVLKSLPTILQWMKATNASSMNINYCRPYFVDGQVHVEEVPSPREMAEKTIACYSLIRESGVRCTYSFLLPLCLLPREFIDTLVSRNELTTVCQLQKGNGLIFEPDGSVIPCHHLFDYKMGKLGKDFTTAAEFEAFMKGGAIREFYQKTGGYPDKRCLSCSLRTRCGGGCLIQYLRSSPAELVVQPFQGEHHDSLLTGSV